MIEATHLKKSFLLKGKKTKKLVEAVKDVSIKIKPGQIVGLIGINGAGKTTTIKMLTTLLEPTSGSIYIDGLDAVKNCMAAKEKINLISGGERSIYWRLTGTENLEYFGSLYGIKKKELSARIEKVLKIVHLEDAKDMPVEKYSKGMKQRLQIARGLINNPDYIFLDEPTLGLDIVIAKELRQYIHDLAKIHQKGILLTTHYMAEAEELCDYFYIINHGEIIMEATPQALRDRYTISNRIRVSFDHFDNDLLLSLQHFAESNGLSMTAFQEENAVELSGENNWMGLFLSFITTTEYNIVNLEKDDSSLEDIVFSLLKENKE